MNNSNGEVCGYVDDLLKVLMECAELKNELNEKLTQYQEAMEKLAAHTKENRFMMAKAEVAANARKYNGFNKTCEALRNQLDRIDRVAAKVLNNLKFNSGLKDGAAVIPANSKYFRNRKMLGGNR